MLRAAHYDRTLMRVTLGFWLFREVWDRYASRFRFVEVYLDGNYEGVYLACETVKRSRTRVELPEVAIAPPEGDITGGYLVHIASNSAGTGFETSSGRIWEYDYPNEAKITPEQTSYLIDYFDAFEQAMEAPDFSSPESGYTKWLDTATAVDFALFQELAKNTDEYTKSAYYQKLPDAAGGRLVTAPIWDNDLSFGTFSNETEPVESWLYECDWNRPVPWWRRLWRDDSFRTTASCRWKSLRAGPLTPSAIEEKTRN